MIFSQNMKAKSTTIILTTAVHTSGLMSGWVMTFSGPLVAPSQAAVSTLWCMDTLLELSKYITALSSKREKVSLSLFTHLLGKLNIDTSLSLAKFISQEKIRYTSN